jgi:hypothetical protein
MKNAPFEYHAPATVDEVLALLAEHADEAKVLAGGQSLVPLLAMRLARPTQLIDINGVTGLSGITPMNGDGVAFGAFHARRRAAPAAGRGVADDRPRRHPQPWDDRRLDRPRRRVGRASGDRRRDRGRDGRALRGW